jgi:phosphopantetheinyl transferase (holo-ACP synthase)
LIRLSGKADELVRKEGITDIQVTLSHVKEMACAVVVLAK